MGTHNYESNISIIGRCYASDSGKRCKFCGLIPPQTGSENASFDETLEAVERPVEATIVAIQNGWRGGILFVGGGAVPERRDQWTTDVLEAMMARFQESLDDDILSQVSFRTSVYPPNDLGQMEKRKRIGMNACEFDNQVMDPAYFKAICPGRGDQKHWFEAQEVGVEVFGPGKSMAAIVAGIELMAGMLEGIEERASKGVLTFPLIFRPFPNAEMREMRAPSAEWYMEAIEKINEIYSRYGYPSIGYF